MREDTGTRTEQDAGRHARATAEPDESEYLDPSDADAWPSPTRPFGGIDALVTGLEQAIEAGKAAAS